MIFHGIASYVLRTVSGIVHIVDNGTMNKKLMRWVPHADADYGCFYIP